MLWGAIVFSVCAFTSSASRRVSVYDVQVEPTATLHLSRQYIHWNIHYDTSSFAAVVTLLPSSHSVLCIGRMFLRVTVVCYFCEKH